MPEINQVSQATIDRVSLLLKPWQLATRPVVMGLDELDLSRPTLFVANHTLLASYDTALAWLEILQRRGVVVRGLTHHWMFRNKLIAKIMHGCGAVDGTPENCAALMQAGEHLLVFPGGAREVMKRKDEKYRLIWKNRLGFVRQAIAHGYQIVPFAMVGAEEAWDVVADPSAIFGRFGVPDELMLPLVRGVGLTPLPRLERLYFHFGAPIDAAPYTGSEGDDGVCFLLREEVQAALEVGIELARAEQLRDPDRYPWKRQA